MKEAMYWRRFVTDSSRAAISASSDDDTRARYGAIAIDADHAGAVYGARSVDIYGVSYCYVLLNANSSMNDEELYNIYVYNSSYFNITEITPATQISLKANEHKSYQHRELSATHRGMENDRCGDYRIAVR